MNGDGMGDDTRITGEKRSTSLRRDQFKKSKPCHAIHPLVRNGEDRCVCRVRKMKKRERRTFKRTVLSDM